MYCIVSPVPHPTRRRHDLVYPRPRPTLATCHQDALRPGGRRRIHPIGCSPHQHEGFALRRLQLHKQSVDSRRRELLVAQGERTTKGFELNLTHPNLYTWENLKEHLEAAHAGADQGDELASRIAVSFFDHNWPTLQDALQKLLKTP